MKLAAKINLLFTVIVSGILLGVALIVYTIASERVKDDFRQRLQSRAKSAANLYLAFKEDATGLLKSLDASSPASLFNKTISIFSDRNEPLYIFHDTTASAVKPDTGWLEEVKEQGEVFHRNANSEIFLYHYADEISFTVLVAAENITGREYLDDLKRIFFIYLPLAIAVTLVAGYLFSRRLVKPVKETIHDVKLITSQNLSHRLYIGSNKDELTELNITFNDLLDRLEESFTIQKRFISNASHEFSTPLTSISSQIEVALLQERSSEEYRKVLSSVLEDAKNLHQLTKNLLEIAKSGTQGAMELDKLRIDELLIRTHSEVLKQNPGYHIELDFPELPEDEKECMVFGNPYLLHIAFKNIMENGCKYSPDRTVRVTFILKEHKAELIFSNKSDLISAEEAEHIFEPFYRSANVKNEPGFGLGLTLTRRIIGLHKGNIEVRIGNDKVTTFIVVLPTLTK